MANFFYRVKNGDTITKLSRKFEVPIGVLIYENNLKKDVACGDVIFIPEISGNKYLICPTDTADSIAEKFGANKEVLLNKNKTPYFFYGEIIYI